MSYKCARTSLNLASKLASLNLNYCYEYTFKYYQPKCAGKNSDFICCVLLTTIFSLTCRAYVLSRFNSSITLLIIAFLGLVVYAFYAACDPLTSKRVKRADQVSAYNFQKKHDNFELISITRIIV